MDYWMRFELRRTARQHVPWLPTVDLPRRQLRRRNPSPQANLSIGILLRRLHHLKRIQKVRVGHHLLRWIPEVVRLALTVCRKHPEHQGSNVSSKSSLRSLPPRETFTPTPRHLHSHHATPVWRDLFHDAHRLHRQLHACRRRFHVLHLLRVRGNVRGRLADQASVRIP